jgi:hypothetical protein
MAYAPIAVFAFRRPDLTSQLLASLLQNPEAAQSSIHVFCDGPRSQGDDPAVSATLAAVRSFDLPNIAVTARPANLGLAANIIDGVGTLCQRHGRVIVLEDDLLVSPTFLRYMNDALTRYADSPEVFHVSGYQYPLDLKANTDAVFLPFINSSGWATWSRAWAAFDASASGRARLLADRRLRRRFDLNGNYEFYNILEQYAAGKVNSWAIRWYLSVFMRGGLALFPAKSLVANQGFGEGATHTNHSVSRQFTAKATPFVVRSFPEPHTDPRVVRRVSSFLGWEYSLPYRVMRKARAVARRLTSKLVQS